jgi:hypothetical protein
MDSLWGQIGGASVGELCAGVSQWDQLVVVFVGLGGAARSEGPGKSTQDAGT